LVTAYKLLKRLEAAIGIEPMNKGFAVMGKLFAQDRDRIRACIFIKRFANYCFAMFGLVVTRQ